jgi:hypothetical protein
MSNTVKKLMRHEDKLNFGKHSESLNSITEDSREDLHFKKQLHNDVLAKILFTS